MKKVILPMLFLLGILLLGMQACKKNGGSSTNTGNGNNNNNPGAKTVKDIYLSGSTTNSSGKSVAMYWKNETPVLLTDGSRNATAASIFVLGNDVYVAGYQDKSGSVLNIATYWKNGVAFPLGTVGGNFDIANSIFVVGNDVHIAGYERNSSTGKSMAKYWYNGSSTNLTNGSTDGRALSVFVSGADVYVAGYENSGGKNVAKYWKNGAPVILPSGSNEAEALCVFVSGSDVYVGGAAQSSTNGNYQAVYWKNGVLSYLTIASDQALVSSIFVSGSDVYAAGIDITAFNYPVVWSKGSQGVLPQPNLLLISKGGGASGIVVNGDDIYVSGELKSDINTNTSIPLYWKNGIGKVLPSGVSNGGGTSVSNIFLTYQ